MPTKRQAAPRHRTKPDAFAAQVGARIRALRAEQGFSFDAFVEETGLGRGYVSELERGLVVPTITALAKVAAALEVTVADLVAGATDRERFFTDLRRVSHAELDRIRRDARRYLKAPEPEMLRVAEEVPSRAKAASATERRPARRRRAPR